MTTEQLKELFQKYEDEYIMDDRIPAGRRLHRRADLCAFLLLAELVPGDQNIIGAAEHDEFYISIDPEQLAASEEITEEDVLTLVRCGLRYDSDCDSLCMFA